MRFAVLIYFATLLCVATAADVGAKGVMVTLTDANFEAEVGIGQTFFIKFWREGCGHCKRMAPVWQQLAESINPDASGVPVKASIKARIGELDCTANPRTCKLFDVDGFPRILLAVRTMDPQTTSLQGKAKLDFLQYHGERDSKSFNAFLRKTPDVIEAVAAQTKVDLSNEEAASITARREEQQATAELNRPRLIKLVTAKNFGSFFAQADKTSTSKLVLFLWKPVATLSGSWEGDIRKTFLTRLAEHLSYEKTDVVIGSLNCDAHADLCHKDQRIALPKKAEFPELILFNKVHAAMRAACALIPTHTNHRRPRPSASTRPTSTAAPTSRGACTPPRTRARRGEASSARTACSRS
jgi:thiol-disulfide isomerase/thioredoxin